MNKCQLKGHENHHQSRICIFKECDQHTRWACDACILDKTHLHGQQNENHIKMKQDLKIIIEQQQHIFNDITYQLQTANSKITKSNNIVNTQKSISQIQRCQQSIKKINEMNLYPIITQIEMDFHSLDQQQIDEIVENQYHLLQQQQQLQNIMSEYQDIINYQQNSTYQIQEEQIQFNYQDYFESEYSGDVADFLQISTNEKLIAYGRYNKKLIVANLATKKIIKEIQFDAFLKSFRFTNDSNTIFCGDDEGFLYAYDVNQDYKQVYKQRIHVKAIDFIKLINNNEVITSSYDRFIKISDIKKNQTLLSIPKTHRNKIFQVEYDSINKVIISCSCDRSIKFFSATNGNNLINKQKAHHRYVNQIQLTHKNSILLSGSYGEIKQWKINYQLNTLKLIRKFTEDENFQGFASILDDRIIIKIFSQQLMIMDYNFKVISQYTHGIENLHYYQELCQTNTLNYLLIMGQNQIKVLKRVQQ